MYSESFMIFKLETVLGKKLINMFRLFLKLLNFLRQIWFSLPRIWQVYMRWELKSE